MLDSILNFAKEAVANTVDATGNVPEDKKSQTIETATHAVTNGLKENFTLGNMSNVMSLFNGGSSMESNPITNNIMNSVATELIQKVGLPQSVANMISTKAVPLVMKLISGKVNDPNEKGFNVESLIAMFSGGNGNHANILGSLGKLFGK